MADAGRVTTRVDTAREAAGLRGAGPHVPHRTGPRSRTRPQRGEVPPMWGAWGRCRRVCARPRRVRAERCPRRAKTRLGRRRPMVAVSQPCANRSSITPAGVTAEDRSLLVDLIDADNWLVYAVDEP